MADRAIGKQPDDLFEFGNSLLELALALVLHPLRHVSLSLLNNALRAGRRRQRSRPGGLSGKPRLRHRQRRTEQEKRC